MGEDTGRRSEADELQVKGGIGKGPWGEENLAQRSGSHAQGWRLLAVLQIKHRAAVLHVGNERS